METFSVLLAICAGNSLVPGPGEFPTQRPVTQSFDGFFDLHLNNQLLKQSQGWWFEMLSCPLWCHCNAVLNHGSWCPGDIRCQGISRHYVYMIYAYIVYILCHTMQGDGVIWIDYNMVLNQFGLKKSHYTSDYVYYHIHIYIYSPSLNIPVSAPVGLMISLLLTWTT